LHCLMMTARLLKKKKNDASDTKLICALPPQK
jgi:hypothetical protein